MKVTFIDETLDELHKKARMEEDVPQPSYPIDIGMNGIIKGTLLKFDFFDYLRRLYNRLGNQLYIIEGGCGVGNALVDLKRGVEVNLTSEERTLLRQLYISQEEISAHFMAAKAGKVYERPQSSVPAELLWHWKYVDGTHRKGLEDKLHTTGVTLTKRHADTAFSVEERYRIDEMIVGPIEQHHFEREYDFVLDFKGAAFHFPRQVIPIYGQILKDFRLAFVRLHTGVQYTGEQLEVEDFRELFYQSCFEIVNHTDPTLPIVDFLVESNKRIATRPSPTKTF